MQIPRANLWAAGGPPQWQYLLEIRRRAGGSQVFTSTSVAGGENK